jgi:hypothetical protein
MIGEIDIYGVFVPSLLVWATAAFCIVLLIRRVARLLRVPSLVWHRPLFDLATFTIVLGTVVALTSLWLPQ